MRKDNMFWGIILVCVGGLLLLDNIGVFSFLTVSIWQLIWPLALISFGGWILWGATRGKITLETESLELPLEEVTRANISLHHGAGTLQVHGEVGGSVLLRGDFEGGVKQESRRNGTQRDITLRTPTQVYMPWDWTRTNLAWDVGLNPAVPIALAIHSGASETHLDLRNLKVNDLNIHTGASSTDIKLPSQAGHTRVHIEGGAASIKLEVPENVAAYIHSQGAIYDLNVDSERFPRQGNHYQSPDYDSAENKVEINIQMGVGSAKIL